MKKNSKLLSLSPKVNIWFTGAKHISVHGTFILINEKYNIRTVNFGI